VRPFDMRAPLVGIPWNTLSSRMNLLGKEGMSQT
jgi:hypothetical protein